LNTTGEQSSLFFSNETNEPKVEQVLTETKDVIEPETQKNDELNREISTTVESLVESTDTHLSPTDSTETAKVQSPNGNNTLKETSSEKQIPHEANSEEKQDLSAQSEEKSSESEKQNGLEVKEETSSEGITNAT
jgi:hypothetical protein